MVLGKSLGTWLCVFEDASRETVCVDLMRETACSTSSPGRSRIALSDLRLEVIHGLLGLALHAGENEMQHQGPPTLNRAELEVGFHTDVPELR